jgi:DNA-binding NarL/FixJ family response regulator
VEVLGQLEREALPDCAGGQFALGESGRWRLHPHEAWMQLALARDLSKNIGADALAECTRTEPPGTGAKARNRMFASRDELRAQEAQVALLAGNGSTTREIAAKLFVSAVNCHKMNVHHTLDVASQRRLPGWLLDAGEPEPADQ